MPNWCNNRVTISGSEEDVQALKNAVQGHRKVDDSSFSLKIGSIKLFSFDAIIPMPDELQGIGSPVQIMTEAEIETYKKEHSDSEWCIGNLPITQERSQELYNKYGTDNWYDWCTKNWTTKWDACDVVLDADESDCVTYRFDTAWGPPTSVYHTLKEQHPNVNISWFYDEPGMEFSGYLPD